MLSVPLSECRSAYQESRNAAGEVVDERKSELTRSFRKLRVDLVSTILLICDVYATERAVRLFHSHQHDLHQICLGSTVHDHGTVVKRNHQTVRGDLVRKNRKLLERRCTSVFELILAVEYIWFTRLGSLNESLDLQLQKFVVSFVGNVVR